MKHYNKDPRFWFVENNAAKWIIVILIVIIIVFSLLEKFDVIKISLSNEN